jgi:hypothetical protein
MKPVTIALLAAAPALSWGQPAEAAELAAAWDSSPAQRGAFAGARLRVPLGTSAEMPRAGLAFAGMERSRITGQSCMAAGVEAGIAASEGLGVAIGGRPAGQLAARRKAGFSALGWVAIGVGATAVAAVLGYGLWLNHEPSNPSD